MAKKSKARTAKRSTAKRSTAKKSPARKAAAKARPAAKTKKTARAKAAPKRKAAQSAAYPSITPYLVVSSAERAIAFYKKAFGADETMRMPSPDGKRLMHAEIRVMGAPVMMSDEFPEYSANKGPDIIGSTTVSMHLYVPDANAAFDRAVKAGCTVLMPLADMFWGDRFGKLRDPFGHEWSIAQHLRDVSPAEMQKAAAQAFSGNK